jgi:hypothetical protein
MMKVVLDESVQMVLRVMNPDPVAQMHAWFNHLARWDTDEEVRKNCHPLQNTPGVFVMQTNSDLRIFFQVDGDTITVLEIMRIKGLSKVS